MASGPAQPDPYAAARRELLREIEADVRLTRGQLGRDSLDPRVLAALASVPRHEFVPEAWRDQAYENHPLPIGHEQTISQPYIVAIMTELLAAKPGDRVLEIGTGSGYQAAVLAALGVEVFSVEIVEPLGVQSRALLERLGYTQVHVRVGDGSLGWPEAAPFDGIIVTAGAREVPVHLVEQLRPGGRMVIPVASGYSGQELVVMEKDAQGNVSRRQVLAVVFVPLTGAG